VRPNLSLGLANPTAIRPGGDDWQALRCQNGKAASSLSAQLFMGHVRADTYRHCGFRNDWNFHVKATLVASPRVAKCYLKTTAITYQLIT
jgi:hypothetical protein